MPEEGARSSGGTVTARQAECLYWISEGKSDWEVGQILKISHKTVNYHVEQAKANLGVATRIQAVVMLVRSGQI